MEALTDDVSSCLEGQLHYALILIGGSEMKHGEDVLPP